MRRSLIAVVLICSPATAQPWSDPGDFSAGTRAVVVARPDQTTFSARAYYPATTPGDGTPVASGAFPAVVFGHDRVTTVDMYRSTLEHLASRGIVVLALESQLSSPMDHAAYDADFRAGLSWIVAQNASNASFLYRRVNIQRLGVIGHGVGGGVALLAASDPRVRTVIAIAPVETAPSAIAASGMLTIPTLVICGDRDQIASQDRYGQPMFGAMPIPRQLITIHWGFHCGFLDMTQVGCDRGTADLSRDEQLEITRSVITPWLAANLGSSPTAWRWIWGPEGEQVIHQSRQVDPKVFFEGPTHLEIGGGVESSAELLLSNTGPASAFAISVLADGFSPAEFRTPVVASGATLTTRVPIVTQGAIFPSTSAGIFRVRRIDDGVTSGWRPITFDLRCSADFNQDAFLDFFDYDDFTRCFGGDCPPGASADFNQDGFADFFDYDDFVRQFETGC